MSELSEEKASQKRQIYESLSHRARKFVDKVGYDAWDPFQQPNDPFDLRRFTTDRTARAMAMGFLQQRKEDHYSNNYARAVLDMCMGLVDKDERYLAMYEFSCWYREQMQAHENVKEQRTFRHD